MVAAVLLLQGACAKKYYGSLAEPLSSDARRMSAVGIRAVQLKSRQGPIAFVATAGDTIAISMRVGHARGAMGTTRHCDQGSLPPTISARVDGDALHLESGRTLPDECVTEWTVALPASIAIEAEVTAGRVSVQGMAGGVSLDITTGDAEVSVADSPADLAVLVHAPLVECVSRVVGFLQDYAYGSNG